MRLGIVCVSVYYDLWRRRCSCPLTLKLSPMPRYVVHGLVVYVGALLLDSPILFVPSCVRPRVWEAARRTFRAVVRWLAWTAKLVLVWPPVRW